jgi:HlyD family secretion protein
MSNSPSPSNRRRLWIRGCALLAIVIMIIAGLRSTGKQSKTDSRESLSFTVQRGPLVISLSESGTIKAQDQIIIKNEIPGRTTVLWVIDEGARVKKGDVLVKLDASKLEDELFSQQIKTQSAESLFIRAREDLAITQNQAASDVEKAETTLAFAKQDLEQYVKGEYPQQLRESEVRITLAEEDLQRAQEKHEWSKVLFKQKFLSQTELQADELAARKAELDLELARGKKKLLEQHTYARELAQLNSDVKQAEMALERVQRKAKANTLQAEVEAATKESESKRQKDRLEEIEQHIKAAEVIAPSDGQVVYATSAQRQHWRSNDQPLAAGKEVREQEALIHLPDTTRMMAAIKVHETHVKKLTVGMPANISVDALPGVNLSGEVKQVAPLPDPTSFWMNPDLKVYDTEVYIDDNDDGLRNGMTCEVEIVAETHTNALFVPVQCVIEENGEPTVYVRGKRGRAEPRRVTTGQDNNRMIHVLDGLEQGEEVLLTPPLKESERQPRMPRQSSKKRQTTEKRPRDRKRKTS